MALLTGREYIESLKDFSPEVYIRGERVRDVWSHPILRQNLYDPQKRIQVAKEIAGIK
jgi:4-hydroxybutyryl-CoA dehydratase / vinylacetyl-CoA-Delta-isomerase